ncbi:MAG: CarD family transcriptional regulator [Christensenellaceae bacterium]|nr:CarD family transcriptional regulator [Christensenellaceae bacterium]
MYNKGDFVVYGNTGVCKVNDISYGPDGVLYYALTPMYDDCMIYAPVEGKVFMRSVMTKEDAISLIDSIPKLDAEPYYNNRIQELTLHYRSIIEEHDSISLAKLLKSIYEKKIAANKSNKKLGQVDERFMRQVQELLYGELAAVLGIEKSAVNDMILERIAAVQN